MSRTKVPDATTPAATFSPEALAALINEVNEGRKLMAEMQAKIDVMAVKPAATNGKSDQSLKNEIQTVRAFKKLGITATPRVDTFTFSIWLSKGFRPKEGSKSVRVNNLRLFHKSQVRPLTEAEKQTAKDQPTKATKRTTSVIPMNAGAPQ